jgi:hypothetical protein
MGQSCFCPKTPLFLHFSRVNELAVYKSADAKIEWDFGLSRRDEVLKYPLRMPDAEEFTLAASGQFLAGYCEYFDGLAKLLELLLEVARSVFVRP